VHIADELKLTNANLLFPGQEESILKNLNWHPKPGSKWFLSGPNGSGKTSLFRGVAGLHDFTGDLARPKIDKLRFLPQESLVIDSSSIRDNLSYGVAKIPAMDRVEQNCREMFGNDFGDKLTFETICGTLSGGEKQRLALARLLTSIDEETRYIFLDEPVSALPAGERDDLFKKFLSLVPDKVCVVAISHDLGIKKLFDNFLTFDNGSCISGA